MLRNETLHNFDTKLKTETDTPTAANSTNPTPENNTKKKKSSSTVEQVNFFSTCAKQKQVILYSMDGKYDTNIDHKKTIVKETKWVAGPG
jgi:hypothetical protein